MEYRCMNCGHPVLYLRSGERNVTFHIYIRNEGVMARLWAQLLMGKSELAPRSKRCPYDGCGCSTPEAGLMAEPTK